MSTDYTDTQLEMLTRRWNQDASPHLSLQLADVYRQRGELDLALPVLERGLATHPGHVSVQVALGRYRLEAGKPEEAATVLREVVDKDAGHLVANKLLVRAYLALGERKNAGDRLELYALLNDNDPELDTLRAAVKGDLPLAAASLAPPTLPVGFAGADSTASTDLAKLARPGRRSLSGALDREPFARLTAEPLVASTLPGFLLLNAIEESARPELVADAVPEPEPEPEPRWVEPVPEPEAPAAATEDRQGLPAPSAAEEVVPAVDDGPSRLAPESVDAGSAATATLGALYLAQGHLVDAKATFEQVLERDPDDAEARAGLVEVETRLGADREAGELPQKASRGAAIAHLQSYLTRIRRAADRLSA